MFWAPSILALLAVSADGAQSRPRWEVSAAVSTGTPAVLPGLAVGGMAEGERWIRSRPVFVCARIGWTADSAANDAWVIDHNQFVLAAGFGVSATLGAGRVWAELGGGAVGVYEVLSRHQLARIEAAGVPAGTETSFALGPYGFGDLGIGLRMWGRIRGFVAGGPSLSRVALTTGPLWRVGAEARLGFAYDF
jgi:hypothetical protein